MPFERIKIGSPVDAHSPSSPPALNDNKIFGLKAGPTQYSVWTEVWTKVLNAGTAN